MAIVAKFHVRHQRAPHQLASALRGEVRALGSVANGVDPAAAGTATEVAHEERVLILITQAHAGIIGETRRTVADVRDGRYAMSCLAVRETHALVQPRAAAGGPRCALEELPADAPAGVAAFHGVYPARGIAAVGIVVAGEKIPVRVKGQFLRIAQADVVQLKLGAVWFAAVNGAGLRRVQLAPVECGDGSRAVADAEINAAIRPLTQPVQIMPKKTDAHTEAAGEAFLLLRFAVSVFVLKQPQVWDVREPHFAVAREHAGSEPVHLVVKAGGEHGGVIHHAVTIAIGEPAHAVGIVGQPGHLVSVKHRPHVFGAL